MTNVIVLRPPARADIEDIFNNTRSQWNPAQAEAYIATLQNCLSRLAVFPKLAPVKRGFQRPIRLYQCGEHVIIYIARDETIDVMRILHKRRNWAALVVE